MEVKKANNRRMGMPGLKTYVGDQFEGKHVGIAMAMATPANSRCAG